MGDISELRGLIIVVTFLGILVFLIGIIPTQFLEAGQMRQVYVPDIFETIDLYQYAEYKTIQLNDTGGGLWWSDSSYYRADIDIGNHNVDLYYKRANYTNKNMFVVHITYEWIIFPADHELEWINAQGLVRSEDVLGSRRIFLQEIEEDTTGGIAKYQVRCDHFTLFTQLAYNTTTYSSIEEAWDMGEYYAFFGINFDDVGTSYNAFALIGMLLFFQLPETHWIINAFIAIPLWATIAYLMYVLVIKVIPFIAGG